MTSSIQERLSLIDPLYYRNVWRAAAGAEDETLDFSVLSVAVTTLGLILGVELLRHKLDVAAVGRPFFKTVLESVYRECKSKDHIANWAYLQDQNESVWFCKEI